MFAYCLVYLLFIVAIAVVTLVLIERERNPSPPSIAPSLAPSIATSTIVIEEEEKTQEIIEEITCLNSDSFIWTNDKGKEFDCTKIRNKEEARQIACLELLTQESCPLSCGECCEDDSTYSFTQNGIQMTCESEDIGDYCDEHKNGQMVRSACPSTCQICMDPVEVE